MTSDSHLRFGRSSRKPVGIKLTISTNIFCIFFLLLTMPGFAAAVSVSYTYDDMNRLKRVTYGNWGVVEYTYDAVGNRLNKIVIPTDTDNDGIPDIIEDANQNGTMDDGETNPYSADTDGDGMPDGWEVDNNLDPLTDDADLDPDGDGLTNLEEYQNGTNPNIHNDHKPLPWIMLLLSD